MEEGVTLDLESRRTQTWLRGPVEEKWLTGIKTRGKELLRVLSYSLSQVRIPQDVRAAGLTIVETRRVIFGLLALLAFI